MPKIKKYFLNENANICYPLDYHIKNAKEEGLTEIELIEANIDKSNPEFVWCREMSAVSDRSECKKSQCGYFKAKKGHVCEHRGKLYDFGKSVKFDVGTSTRNKN